MVLHGLTVWESRKPPGSYEAPKPKAWAFLFLPGSPSVQRRPPSAAGARGVEADPADPRSDVLLEDCVPSASVHEIDCLAELAS